MDNKKLISAYARLVPHRLLELLGAKDVMDLQLGMQVERKLTILYADIRGFSAFSESLTSQDKFNFINSFLSQMEPLISVNSGLVDKYIGDGIMAIFPESAEDAVRCAQQMLRQLDHYNEGRLRAGYTPIRIGIGINTGIAMIGTIGGYNRMDCTVFSDVVNLASRIEGMTKRYRVDFLVSDATYSEIGDSLKKYSRFIDRTKIKGKLQAQSIYEFFSEDHPNLCKQKHANKRIFEEAMAYYHHNQIKECEVLLKKCLVKDQGDAPARIYLHRCRHFEENGFHEGAYELTQNVQWSNVFAINEENIDAQHKQLVEQSSQLIQLGREGKRDEYLELLQELRQKSVAHFDYEEKLMEQIDYPFLQYQKSQHQYIIKEFDVLKKEAQSSRTSDILLIFKTRIVLVDWIVNHTLKADRHLGKYIADTLPAEKQEPWKSEE